MMKQEIEENLKNQGVNMKIFVDGGKRPAVTRMFPIWDKLGHKVVSKLGVADVQLSVIKISERAKVPIVLRLDGVYYDKGMDYTNRNLIISRSHKLAEAVVYQSNFSKLMCKKYLSKRKNPLYDVIYNGVDNSGWYNPIKHDGINIVSCAKWRRWKRLPETIEIFDEFLKTEPIAKLHIIGPMNKGSKIIKHKNVLYHNPKQQIGFNKIKKIYQTMDMFLHIAKKDWCPSTVVEAIAAGLPVITTDACGGAAEMCTLTDGCVVVPDEKEHLEPVHVYSDGYNKISRETVDSVVKAMVGVVDIRHKVTMPNELHVEYTAKKYLQLMEKVIEEKK